MVKLGYYDELVFRIYDMNGEILFHAMLNSSRKVGDYCSWEVVGDENGFLAFDTKPRDAVRVYVLELQRCGL